jgi:hypothetical protein
MKWNLKKRTCLLKLNDSRVLVDKLKLDIIVLNEQNKSLEKELNASKDQLKKFFSDKLDKMLSVQKIHGDKSRLGFVGNCSFLLL